VPRLMASLHYQGRRLAPGSAGCGPVAVTSSPGGAGRAKGKGGVTGD
jgi:hypothetical protein